jgi:hypothetical protein
MTEATKMNIVANAAIPPRGMKAYQGRGPLGHS